MSLLSERQKEELYVTSTIRSSASHPHGHLAVKSEVYPRVSAREQLHRCVQCPQVGFRCRVHPRPEGEICRVAREEVDERDTVAEEGTQP